MTGIYFDIGAMVAGTSLRVCSTTSSHDLDGELVLLNEAAQQIFVLNRTASYVWSCIADGLDADAIAARISAELDECPSRVRQDVVGMLREWQSAGMVSEPDRAPTEISSPADRVAVTCDETTETVATSVLTSGRYSAAFRVLDVEFAIATEISEAINEIDVVIGHLRVPPDSVKAPISVFELKPRGNGWALSEDGEERAFCDDLSGLAPMIHGVTMSLAYLRSECFGAIHGAIVAGSRSCALMPGESGNGKSTLSAALMAHGLSCYTDDLAILSTPPIRVRPVPLRIGLKTGSWRVLEPYLPVLSELPIYERADNQRVKYLPLPRPEKQDLVAITAIVFPKYTPGSDGQAVPIRRADALQRLASAGYDLPGRLTTKWVAAVVDWIRDVPCFELHFDELRAAVRSVSSLLD